LRTGPAFEVALRQLLRFSFSQPFESLPRKSVLAWISWWVMAYHLALLISREPGYHFEEGSSRNVLQLRLLVQM
jgi:hypothetical protein